MTNKQKAFDELKAWLEETADEPLETMGGFFDTPLTLEHELSAMRECGPSVESAKILEHDDHTAIICAKNTPPV